MVRVKRSVVFSIILLVLALVIIGKMFYIDSENKFLYIYGVGVTTFVFLTFFLAHVRYKDPSEAVRKKGFKMKEEPFISCICAVYNDERIIDKCVDSLIHSTYKNKEIIVVNDASTDNTWGVLKKYSFYSQVRILNLKKNVGKKKALAEGIKISKGEIFVFTDSDSIVAPDAIERIIEVFEYDSSVGAISGHARALNANKNLLTKIQDSWYETQFSLEKAFESAYGCVTCVSGPLAVFRRAAVFNYIPAWINDSFLGKEFRFATDRQMTAYVLGDRELNKKLKKKYKNSFFVRTENHEPKKWKVLYSKSAKVWTNVPDTFSNVIKQHVRWKKSFIRNLFFTGRFYWKRPLPSSMKFYAGIIFTILGPFIALRHLIYLPMQGSYLSGVYYLGGIMFIGSLYAVAFKVDNKDSHVWVYRPLMSVMSTLVLSWLLFYSTLTIRRQVWHRG